MLNVNVPFKIIDITFNKPNMDQDLGCKKKS